MTRARHDGHLARRVETQIETAREQLGPQVDQQPVGAAHDLLRRLTDGRVRPYGRADLPHQARRRHVVPLHVTDDRGGQTVRGHQVVEVPLISIP